ncbi:MAG: spiro-SPASM protein [Spirochaetaceae bacterium]|nr:spiro-SPASM protein [Spirochaetaceae bacterium]
MRNWSFAAASGILKGMNAAAALFGGGLGAECFENVFGGKNALQLALERTAAFPGVKQIRLFVDTKVSLPPGLDGAAAGAPAGAVPLEVITRDSWDNAALFDELASCAAGFDCCYYAWADAPFLNVQLAASLSRRHIEYPAEYTYADGFAYGFAPEVLSPATPAVLRKLLDRNAELAEAKVSRDSVFLVLQKDINAFEIETEIASIDHRPWRLSLTADSRRSLLLCRRFFDEGVLETNDIQGFTERIIREKPALLRTLPAFFPVQVTAACPQGPAANPACSICPYMPLSADGMTGELSPKRWAELLDRITAFAGDAVLDISLWGEPLLHTRRSELIAQALSRPGVSLIIETSRMDWDEAELAAYAKAASDAAQRLSRTVPAPLSWIVSADIPTAENPAPVSLFQKYFPACSYHQIVRKRGNEDTVESFYRYWKGRGANVIVQKYDRFAGTLPDLSTADLSPIRRHPCWHILRDVPVLLDGRVPLCREHIEAVAGAEAGTSGNVFDEPLDVIWSRMDAVYREHCAGVYAGFCGACDEWYTYNF